MALPQLQKDFRDADTQEFASQFINRTEGKYNIGTYTYPEGLGNSSDLQHYIAFFINVRGKSKFNKQVGINNNAQRILEDVKVGQGQNRLDPNRTSKAVTVATGAAGAYIGGGSALLSGIKDGQLSKTDLVGAAKGTAVGGVIGTAAGKALQAAGVIEPDTLKRISDVITLHIQEKPTTSYSINYQDKELGTIGGLLAGGSSATDATETIGGISRDASAAAIAGIVSMVSGAFGGTTGNLLELGTKQKTNSFREQFFESIDYRTFNFRHTFMPRSQAEAESVRRILNLFKFHMHPELSNAGLFYIYPSEFEIKYFYRDRENTYFDKISSCVLEDMSVEYGGDIFSTFDDGNPVEVNLTLKFKELELLTKERITQGY